jgi:lipopolysaccharide transport system permease protein
VPSAEPDPLGAGPGPRQRVVLEPRRGWQPIDLRELWAYRDLVWFLTLREVQVRYKQTVLGAAWAILQPLMAMIVFSIFFGKLAGLNKQSDVPYPVLTFAALLPWQLFAGALSNAGNSLVANQNLITKVYFPRLAIPLSAVLAGLVDFAIGLAMLLVMMAWYGVAPAWGLLALPLFTAWAVVAALAVGLGLSALNVQYRDVRYTIPFLVQVWMFCTPVAYPIKIVPENWRALYGLNPMVGVVEGFRWAMLGQRYGGAVGIWTLAASAAATLLILVGSLFYFRRMERHFADVV